MGVVGSISKNGSTRLMTDSWGSKAIQNVRSPWWLWWNILSLDAPAVAVIWALLFASSSGVKLRLADKVVLALSVWAIYTSDRLLDGWSAKDCSALQERHLFCARHRVALSSLVALGFVTILWTTAEFITPTETLVGMKLGAIVGVYLISIHACRGSMARFVPKEIAVGGLFAAGATLPVWSRTEGLSARISVSIILFALLCCLNCLAIECWENGPCDSDWFQRCSPVIRWAERRINLLATALAATAFGVTLVLPPHGSVGSSLPAISLAALLMLLLNRFRNRLSAQALRVLADATLVLAGGLALVT